MKDYVESMSILRRVEIFLRFSTLFRRRNLKAISTPNQKCHWGVLESKSRESCCRPVTFLSYGTIGDYSLKIQQATN